MATHSSVFAWRMPWTEEPARLQSIELQKVRHDWVTNTSHLDLPFSIARVFLRSHFSIPLLIFKDPWCVSQYLTT